MARWGERGMEAPENSKESSNSAHANGMNERMFLLSIFLEILRLHTAVITVYHDFSGL